MIARILSVDAPHDIALLSAAGKAGWYADRLAALRARDLTTTLGVDADRVAYTGVAYTGQGVPVGHAALRWTGGDLELKRMYVAPSHRGTGVSVALLAAIERRFRTYFEAQEFAVAAEVPFAKKVDFMP